MPTGETQTLCKCPKCEAFYYRQVLWTGKGVPRIYCQICADRLFRKGTPQTTYEFPYMRTNNK